MINKKEFLEKYPDIEAFKAEHPIGQIFRYYDRDYWEIRNYMSDEYPNGEKFDLVILRTFVRYKEGKEWIRHWTYKAQELYDFFTVYDFCKREYGKEFTKKEWEEHDNEKDI